MEHESWAMAAALVMIAGVVAGKIVTVRLLAFVERRIKNVKHIKKDLLRDLRMGQQQAKVLQATKSTLEAKKLKLEGKRSRLNNELTAMKDEANQRERVKRARQNRVVRPTVAG